MAVTNYRYTGFFRVRVSFFEIKSCGWLLWRDSMGTSGSSRQDSGTSVDGAIDMTIEADDQVYGSQC
jgi:hypothetical protein